MVKTKRLLRTEVKGLELELEGNVLSLNLNGHVELVLPLKYPDTVIVANDLFDMKNMPGQNFFDHVIDTVEKSMRRKHGPQRHRSNRGKVPGSKAARRTSKAN